MGGTSLVGEKTKPKFLDVKLSVVRKFNNTPAGYNAAARPLEEGPVEVDALPMMDVVADGEEAGVFLPETNGVIPVGVAYPNPRLGGKSQGRDM